ncbi:hypothetical protein B5V02_19615 [Mesorhizobium kowhaii]|uniref:Uncharacterized protein n=2 Tax=Mesorhizobium kowhaii TaxID=1300272 RepID=A0A2W7C509_9HYPH|nr:hypothetical protein B5V02_19615 [Mesorhizobium kowhaii]
MPSQKAKPRHLLSVIFALIRLELRHLLNSTRFAFDGLFACQTSHGENADMSPSNNEEAIQRDDKWLLSTIFKISDPDDLTPFLQSFCNALPERPLITEISEAEALLNTQGNKVKTYCLKTAIGLLRAIKTTKGRLAFLKTAHACIPIELERTMEHIGYSEYAGTVGTEMLREISKPKPIHFHARFTHPSMGLEEPEGCCFLFRLEDQSELFLIISESGTILTEPEPPFQIIAEKSKEDTEKALADFHARNREELDPRRALATVGEAVPVYTRKDYPLIRELPGADDMPATWEEWRVNLEERAKERGFARYNVRIRPDLFKAWLDANSLLASDLSRKRYAQNLYDDGLEARLNALEQERVAQDIA